MNTPKTVKYRKTQKGSQGKIRGIAFSGSTIDKGEFALVSQSAARVTASQIESVRRVIIRSLSKKGKLIINVFPQKNYTKKPAEVRMGSGKGSPEFWAAIVQPGMVLFQLTGVGEKEAREAFALANYKLSVSTRFVKRSCYE